MALVRPGLDAFLGKTMADTGYMGPHFGPLPDPPRAKFLATIADRWDVLGDELGVDRPYKTFYPGQVFRWDYMEALVAFPESRS